MNEEKKIKKIRDKIKSGKLSLGSWIQIPHPDIAKIICNQGYEWVSIDLEHGSGSMNDIPNLSNTITNTKSACFVRIAEDNFKNINRFLDLSISGIIFSKIEDHVELSNILLKLYFPPFGTRGYGFSIDNDFGKDKVTLKDLKFRPLFFPDKFINHGKPDQQNIECGIDHDSIVRVVLGALGIAAPAKFSLERA